MFLFLPVLPGFTPRSLGRTAALLVVGSLSSGLFPAVGLAAERDLSISAPATALAGAEVEVSIAAATHLGGGEQIGFLHGEYSVDGGRAWTGFCYDQNLGPSATREVAIKTGPPGSKIVVRVRVAFRDGAAGDVDFSGAAIRWTDTWRDWREPPAKVVTISVVAPRAEPKG
jgi:hypothetical protein